MDKRDASHCVLYLGPKWRGSDARALAEALRELGCVLIEVDYEDFFPLHWTSFSLRGLRRLIRPLCARDYNRAVAAHAENPSLDFILVFKGMLLQADTLSKFRVPRYCLYPDVSFIDHGKNIWNCLPRYDCVFTTKSFHMTDPRLLHHVRQLKLVPHGADPEVHRPVHLSASAKRRYGADVSFVGCWSPKKEALVQHLVQALPACHLRLWGPGWERSEPKVRAKWEGRGVYGDEIALVHRTSMINLGLLSEAGGDTHQGDQTTTRTWQIPACKAFLLHERTSELMSHFKEDKEAACFDSPSELASKVRYFLS